MDTNTGKIYKNLDEALSDGVKIDDVIEFDESTIEGNKLLMGVLRFLLRDNAFNKEFLLTTIIEYICNNGRGDEK